jgi:hypothetical protein
MKLPRFWRLVAWTSVDINSISTALGALASVDIEETLTPLITGQICIQGALANADINIYLCERLQSDSKLRKWLIKVQKEIEETLMNGAHGM